MLVIHRDSFKTELLATVRSLAESRGRRCSKCSNLPLPACPDGYETVTLISVVLRHQIKRFRETQSGGVYSAHMAKTVSRCRKRVISKRLWMSVCITLKCTRKYNSYDIYTAIFLVMDSNMIMMKEMSQSTTIIENPPTLMFIFFTIKTNAVKLKKSHILFCLNSLFLARIKICSTTGTC